MTKKLITPRQGVVVNRVLLCHNPHCIGIVQTPKGPAAVKIGQRHYSHVPPPPCPDCGIPMHIESMHAVGLNHQSKMDKNKLMDKIQAEVFTQAERTSHKLAEGASVREGDVAKFIPDESAAAYLRETEKMAKQKGLHTGFADSNFQGHRKMVKGVAGDPTFAHQTIADGALLPVEALSAAVGNTGFRHAGGTGATGINAGGGYQFWRNPTASRKIR